MRSDTSTAIIMYSWSIQPTEPYLQFPDFIQYYRIMMMPEDIRRSFHSRKRPEPMRYFLNCSIMTLR